MVEIIAALATLSWGSAAAILAAIVPTGGFCVVLLKMYFNSKSAETPATPEEGCTEVQEHAKKIVKINNEIEKLKLELEHLKESLHGKDEQIEKQIDEMKETIKKLTDMLINLLTSS